MFKYIYIYLYIHGDLAVTSTKECRNNVCDDTFCNRGPVSWCSINLQNLFPVKKVETKFPSHSMCRKVQ